MSNPRQFAKPRFILPCPTTSHSREERSDDRTSDLNVLSRLESDVIPPKIDIQISMATPLTHAHLQALAAMSNFHIRPERPNLPLGSLSGYPSPHIISSLQSPRPTLSLDDVQVPPFLPSSLHTPSPLSHILLLPYQLPHSTLSLLPCSESMTLTDKTNAVPAPPRGRTGKTAKAKGPPKLNSVAGLSTALLDSQAEVAALKAKLSQAEDNAARYKKYKVKYLEKIEKEKTPVLIRRPPGERGKNGWRLIDHMGLSENKTLYNEIMRGVRLISSEAGLDPSRTFPQQEPGRLHTAYKWARERFPFLARFDNNWVTREFLKQTLCDRRKYVPKTKKAVEEEDQTDAAADLHADDPTEELPAANTADRPRPRPRRKDASGSNRAKTTSAPGSETVRIVQPAQSRAQFTAAALVSARASVAPRSSRASVAPQSSRAPTASGSAQRLHMPAPPHDEEQDDDGASLKDGEEDDGVELEDALEDEDDALKAHMAAIAEHINGQPDDNDFIPSDLSEDEA